MTSNFTKLSIVTAIFLGLASYSVLKNKDSNIFSERGNTFIENLPSKLNDIQKIKYLNISNEIFTHIDKIGKLQKHSFLN